jgi:predicted protein tyrosine phosphatase
MSSPHAEAVPDGPGGGSPRPGPAPTVCGLAELDRHDPGRYGHVLSLLDPGQPPPDALAQVPSRRRLVLHFHDIVGAEPGWVAPGEDDVRAILAFGATGGTGAAGLLIHCNRGISRSTAAFAMILAQADPRRDDAATFRRLAEIRPGAWPNSLMIGHADRLLGRGGRLVAALGGFYRTQLVAFPAYRDHLVRIGRGSELDLAGDAHAR